MSSPVTDNQTHNYYSDPPNKTEIVVTPTNNAPSGYYVAQGIQAGSWAILLLILAIVVFARKGIGTYFSNYIALIGSLKERSETNSETIRLIAQNDQKVSEILEQLQSSSDRQIDLIAQWSEKFEQDNKVIIAMLRYLVKAEQDRQQRAKE